MLGAICGDVIGSAYERNPVKTTDFPLFCAECRFTDDTVLTVAVASALLHGRDYAEELRHFARAWPDAGYGGAFLCWMRNDCAGPYGSWGNGSATRVSPVAHAFHSAEEVLAEARKSAEVTHDHPEGIKGAQAVALAVFLACEGADKESIREEIGGRFGYDLDRSLEDIRPTYRFDVSCQGSVPESIIAFLESSDVESAIRNAVSLGGDSDTMAAIAGAIAEGYYQGVPKPLAAGVKRQLPSEFINILHEFDAQYAI